MVRDGWIWMDRQMYRLFHVGVNLLTLGGEGMGVRHALCVVGASPCQLSLLKSTANNRRIISTSVTDSGKSTRTSASSVVPHREEPETEHL